MKNKSAKVKKSSWRHVPNILTFARMILIVPLLLLLHYDSMINRLIAVYLYALTSVTDYIDGIVARKYNFHSNFGRCFDSIADKLFVIILMMMLIKVGRSSFVAFVILASREIVISGVREFLSGKEEANTGASTLAKWKAFFQMFGLGFFVLGDEHEIMPHCISIGEGLIWIAAVLSIITAYDYIKKNAKLLKMDSQ